MIFFLIFEVAPVAVHQLCCFEFLCTGREQAVRQNHRRARRLFVAVSLLPRRLLSIRSQHIPVQRVVVVGSTQINIPFDLMTSAENFLFAEHHYYLKDNTK